VGIWFNTHQQWAIAAAAMTKPLEEREDAEGNGTFDVEA
jgi:hypothetical protein